jgi:hypothetical protein
MSSDGNVPHFFLVTAGAILTQFLSLLRQKAFEAS